MLIGVSKGSQENLLTFNLVRVEKKLSIIKIKFQENCSESVFIIINNIGYHHVKC